MSTELTVHIADILARQWLASYKKRPKTTSITTIVVAIALGTGLYFGIKADNERIASARRENLSFDKQLKGLNETETNLKNLLSFVAEQRQRLNESENLLASLKEEKDRLDPVVSAERKMVKAILDAQNESQKTDIWRERMIGFGFGIAGSLIATVIWTIGAITLNRRKKKDGGASASAMA